MPPGSTARRSLWPKAASALAERLSMPCRMERHSLLPHPRGYRLALPERLILPRRSMSANPARRRLIEATASLLTVSAATVSAVVPASASTPAPVNAPILASAAPSPAQPAPSSLAVRSSAPSRVATQAADSTLPVDHTCSSSLRIKAQRMSAQQLTTTCDSLAGQDTYFHSVVKDNGQPVVGDKNTTLEVVVFDSSSEYRRLAGNLYGVPTNNGGVYLEGNPSATGNQARFIAYRDETASAFTIKNLNHEYTHYLDGRYNMYGDWNANISTPTLWWIEGLAEYVSYGYLNKPNTWAAGEAPKQTYNLSTLFDTTQQHDQNRIYAWGYLAVQYLLKNHQDDVTKVLGYYRTGAWQAARTYIKQNIGTRYDADFKRWLFTGSSDDDPTTPPPTGSRFENTDDVQIGDETTVESPITVTDITGNAPAKLAVTVDIRHTFRGDLRIELVAPDGGTFVLKDYSTYDSADNVQGTFTVDASTKAANGTWKLRATDRWVNDTGYINAWSLQF
ncbi:collagenase [Streptomyces zaomyceticus]|uniref:collagenase n=1 Tax=Streptomyces zaomyceticus TaxID=68286 RepID=UPI0037957026